MSQPTPDAVSEIRSFNRFYTRHIGVLREDLLHTPYSLAEARVIYELAHRDDANATLLGRELGLDAGYLSRIVARLDQQGILDRTRSAIDGRQHMLRLTEEGKRAFAMLDQRSSDEVAGLLTELTDEDKGRLVAAMHAIVEILNRGASFKLAEPYVLRQHRPGDMGWIVHRHGVLYTQQYGWDASFEALVAQIASNFISHYDPARERCWIAEMDGEPIGSVVLVQAGETVAKLRLLLVEPKARGLGVGSRLVQECIRFARSVGYQTLTLWTQSMLVEARHIYRKAGFTLISQGPHHSFGQDLVEETWELQL